MLQDRFDTRRLADRIDEQFVPDVIDEPTARSSRRGTCSSSRPPTRRDGRRVRTRAATPGFVRVLDEHTLAFPSYDGNGMYLSARQPAGQPGCRSALHRLREGPPAAAERHGQHRRRRPAARAMVRGAVRGPRRARAVFPNCPRYIHQMRSSSGRASSRGGVRPPVPEWKRRTGRATCWRRTIPRTPLRAARRSRPNGRVDGRKPSYPSKTYCLGTGGTTCSAATQTWSARSDRDARLRSHTCSRRRGRRRERGGERPSGQSERPALGQLLSVSGPDEFQPGASSDGLPGPREQLRAPACRSSSTRSRPRALRTARRRFACSSGPEPRSSRGPSRAGG